MELKINELLELIREQVELVEESKGKNAGLKNWLPQMRITDQWGKGKPSPGVIDKVAGLVVSKKEPKDLANGLKILDGFYKSTGEIASQEAFAGILFLEVLSVAVKDFNKDTRGLIFESILAKLIGGKTTENKQMIDIVVGSEAGSQLKMRQDRIKGSRKLLLDYVLGEEKPIQFVVGSDEGENLVFREFEINEGNVDWFAGSVKVKEEDGKEQLKPAVEVYRNEEKPRLGQFSFSMGKVIEKFEAEPIATFPIRNKPYEEKAKELIEKLEKGLVPLYENLKQITDNANEYFLGKEDRDVAAQSLIEASKKLPQTAKQAIGSSDFNTEE